MALGPDSPIDIGEQTGGDNQGGQEEPGDKLEVGGSTWSDASKTAEKDKGKSGTGRGANKNKAAGSEPIHADLELMGYPKLRAKTVITMQGVGPAASGDWYVKKVSHKWSKGHGFRSSAHLVRGAGGSGTGESNQGGGGTGSSSGGTGGRSPLVMFADIWDGGKVKIGKRNDNSGSTATFLFGDGSNVISFKYHVKPQLNRGAGEKNKGRGRGVNLIQQNKPYAVGPSEKSGSGGGGGGQ